MRWPQQDSGHGKGAGTSLRAWPLVMLLAAGPLLSGTNCTEEPLPFVWPPVVPDCQDGQVCINIVNRTCVDVDIILYVHNGYDLEGSYAIRAAVECCQEEQATQPCLCLRPGADTGEMQLYRPELFGRPENRYDISNGSVVYTIKGRPDELSPSGDSATVSLPCGDVKSMGLDVGRAGELPALVQERSGPQYRCTMIATDRGGEVRPEDVPCGGTIRYTLFDRNDCAGPNLTVFRVMVDVSADCTPYPSLSGTDR
jgi:hypothetical protein